MNTLFHNVKVMIGAIIAFVILGAPMSVYAYYADSETSTDNTFTASTLDIALSGASVMSVSDMMPGESVNGEVIVTNSGSLDADYRATFEKVAGDDDLCDALEITAVQGSTTHPTVVLSAFDIDADVLDGGVNENDVWQFTVALPAGAPTDASEESCDFDIVFTAHQSGFASGGFNDVETFGTHEVDSGDWIAPAVPTGLRRLKASDHNVVYACGDSAQIQSMHPDWNDNTESDFSHYEYTSFNAPSGAIGLDEKIFYDSIFEYNGSWLPGEGTYGFAVRAVDNVGNKSTWALGGTETLADSCQITYDNTAPIISAIDVSDPYDTKGIANSVSVDVLWDTDENATSNIVYGTVTHATGIVADYSDAAPLPMDSSADSLHHTVAINNINPYDTYYFRVITVDGAGNETVSIEQSFSVSTPVVSTPGVIVLNEFMPNPEGGDDNKIIDSECIDDDECGEWAELYNNSSNAVDVGGWKIKDNTGNTWSINALRADNDGDWTNDGATIVPAHGYLVVYRNDASMALNNSGAETIELYDGVNTLMDAHTFDAGVFDEGKTFARFPDGIGPWIDPDGTPGEENELSNDELSFFRSETFVQCFEETDALVNDEKGTLCDPLFLEYIGMIDEINDTNLAYTTLLSDVDDGVLTEDTVESINTDDDAVDGEDTIDEDNNNVENEEVDETESEENADDVEEVEGADAQEQSNAPDAEDSTDGESTDEEAKTETGQEAVEGDDEGVVTGDIVDKKGDEEQKVNEQAVLDEAEKLAKEEQEKKEKEDAEEEAKAQKEAKEAEERDEQEKQKAKEEQEKKEKEDAEEDNNDADEDKQSNSNGTDLASAASGE